VAQPMTISYNDLEYLPEGIYLFQGKAFTGVAVDYDVCGVKNYELPFLDGHEHGLARGWHLNGQLGAETPYANGVVHGTQREWFEDGSLRSETICEFGHIVRREVRNQRQEVVELYERPST